MRMLQPDHWWFFWGPCLVTAVWIFLTLLAARRLPGYVRLRKGIRWFALIWSAPLVLFIVPMLLSPGEGPEAGFAAMDLWTAVLVYPIAISPAVPLLIASYAIPPTAVPFPPLTTGDGRRSWWPALAIGCGFILTTFMILNRLLPFFLPKTFAGHYYF